MKESIAYLNGSFLPLGEARISPLDRGFLFADGVYELVPTYNGVLFGWDKHLARLENGLKALNIHANENWQDLFEEMARRNRGEKLGIYLQVTRGAAEVRDHRYSDTSPTIFMMSRPLPTYPEHFYTKGIHLITQPDIRWGACNIKSISLLPNIMARQAAEEAGVTEAILVHDGIATECASSNFFLVKDGKLITSIKDNRILPGVSRDILIELAQANGIEVTERDIAEAELMQADELLVTSSSKDILPATMLDGEPVGNGKVGTMWTHLWKLFQDHQAEARRLKDVA